MEYTIREIETERQLRDVLALCYRVLGHDDTKLYGYEAWAERLKNGLQPLTYAEKDGKVISAVLGRAENKDSLVIGFVACDEAYRGQGITRKLMEYFESRAREMGYQTITLGSKADLFYEKCGYKRIFEIDGQNIYQKVLEIGG